LGKWTVEKFSFPPPHAALYVAPIPNVSLPQKVFFLLFFFSFRFSLSKIKLQLPFISGGGTPSEEHIVDVFLSAFSYRFFRLVAPPIYILPSPPTMRPSSLAVSFRSGFPLLYSQIRPIAPTSGSGFTARKILRSALWIVIDLCLAATLPRGHRWLIERRFVEERSVLFNAPLGRRP